MAIGLGPEWNMNAHEHFAGGITLDFDFNLAHHLAAGLTFTASHNFNGVTVWEPAALFRWYFLQRGYNGFFAQIDVGAALIQVPWQKETHLSFLGGARVGYRIPLKRFYIEPFGRGGYPFLFGIGVLAGIQF